MTQCESALVSIVSYPWMIRSIFLVQYRTTNQNIYHSFWDESSHPTTAGSSRFSYLRTVWLLNTFPILITLQLTGLLSTEDSLIRQQSQLWSNRRVLNLTSNQIGTIFTADIENPFLFAAVVRYSLLTGRWWRLDSRWRERQAGCFFSSKHFLILLLLIHL